MKRRRIQITCLCSAYDFPHRLGGGSCSGTEWAEAYHLLITEQCNYCNCLNNGVCEVATGQEDIGNCEGAKDFLHYNNPARLPMSVDDILTEQEENYYNGREIND